ncbi:hypothetical protein PHLGIDRAFT_129251 [Phlebiopsis gigantea 11061_1 CR5-6]|uniref:DUF1168-domain-containing protein n=1 Tax=Phlebiopsis gigantea (strain 11061_1 CR5-6) TaxID=745531 RepID=A0A0C3S7T2_PHLG1|nr:hypothetical protein PHLGIDRAFT_129251 [Phlebiopsis gigantea 11061_1 CR5-6]
MSESPVPSGSGAPPINRHAATAVDRQKAQLEKLLKDPAKPAYIPPPPKEKTIRPAREMMKNVQGSSAGAGSGEFHVYKASRRREYERLKLMDEETKQETEQAEFARKRQEWEDQAEAKTAKNRAKRQKKKASGKAKGGADSSKTESSKAGTSDVPLKKRRLVNGQELVFRRPGEESDDDEDGRDDVGPVPSISYNSVPTEVDAPVPIVEASRIVIHEED